MARAAHEQFSNPLRICQFAFVSFARFVSALPVTIGASMTAANCSGVIECRGANPEPDAYAKSEALSHFAAGSPSSNLNPQTSRRPGPTRYSPHHFRVCPRSFNDAYGIYFAGIGLE